MHAVQTDGPPYYRNLAVEVQGKDGVIISHAIRRGYGCMRVKRLIPFSAPALSPPRSSDGLLLLGFACGCVRDIAVHKWYFHQLICIRVPCFLLIMYPGGT